MFPLFPNIVPLASCFLHGAVSSTSALACLLEEDTLEKLGHFASFSSPLFILMFRVLCFVTMHADWVLN